MHGMPGTALKIIMTGNLETDEPRRNDTRR
jgi:hypothetical protein